MNWILMGLAVLLFPGRGSDIQIQLPEKGIDVKWRANSLLQLLVNFTTKTILPELWSVVRGKGTGVLPVSTNEAPTKETKDE